MAFSKVLRLLLFVHFSSFPCSVFTLPEVSPSDVASEDSKRTFKNRVVIVTTVIRDPYVMLRPSASDYTGNDQYEGFVKDILDLLSQSLGFSYRLQISADGYYGRYNETSETWNGMMGEIVSRAADMAAADLTMTSHRMQSVDFIPFITVGVGLLMKRPHLEMATDDDVSAAYFFLKGFAVSVWVCAVVAFVAVSLVHYFISKLTQVSNHPINIIDGMSYSFGNVFFRKDSVNSSVASLKLLSGVWWIFTFFLVVLYISSMSSNMMVQLLDLRRVVDRQNFLLKDCNDILDDFLKTGKPEIGLLQYGSTQEFFMNSKIPKYAQFGAISQRKPHLLSRSYAEGIDRIQEQDGNYAFVMESSSSKYMSGRFCDLYAAPGTFDTKQHAFAVLQESPYKLPLHREMLKLQEAGTLRTLEEKWWKNSCPENDEWLRLQALDHNPVSIHQMSGVFYFLLAGVAVSLIIFLLEMIFKRRGTTAAAFIEERQELTNCEDVEAKRVKNVK